MSDPKSLRTQREERGWSRAQLAYIAGVSARSVGRAEDGTLKSDVILECIELALADDAAPSPRERRGFALVDVEQHRQIASLGGRTAHELGRGHQFTSEEAREAGRKGGIAASKDKERMSQIGKLGGQKRGQQIKDAALRRRTNQGEADGPEK